MLTKKERRIINAKNRAVQTANASYYHGYVSNGTNTSSNNRDKSAEDLKVALVAMAKCENKYLSEWVEYNISIGFDRIFLYDNNDLNGERCRDCFSEEQMEKVTIIDSRGVREIATRIQCKNYDDCYHRMCREYDWVAFLDIDEFLTFTEHKSVKEYLADKRFRDFDGIRINWLNYGDNGHLRYEPGSVIERFPEPCSEQVKRCDFKTIYRTNIGRFNMKVHYGSAVKSVCDNKGDVTPQTMNCHMAILDRSLAYIRHYITKSTEEFITIKRARRRKGDVANIRLSNEFYFTFNEKTKEKEEMFRKMLK